MSEGDMVSLRKMLLKRRSEHEYSILLQILADVMSLTSKVDHIGTDESVEVISRLVPGRLAKPLQ